MALQKNWMTIAESSFPWERDALDFVRRQFPSHEPYRAWANFEFIADDGSVNEVDLLVFTPQGFFLIEIKSRPGRLRGDAGTWTWETDGKLTTVDNPYQLANSKAKKLRSLLQRQKACKSKGQVPFIEALVFCSATDLHCELQGTARHHVCLRDRAAEAEKPGRPGILAAIKRRECDGLDPYAKGTHDRPTAKMVAQATEQAGIRASQRSRKVSDYELDQLIDEGPGYQDWQATHSTLKNVRRRVRIYNVRTGATIDERQTIERAARREAELLESLQHPGVLRREGFTEHELGPALIFEHDPKAIRLDHFLTQSHEHLTVDQRLDLLRQIAEVMRFAHEKRIVHRALCPQSILVTVLDDGRHQVKVFNWQVGYRSEGTTTSSSASRVISATSHVDRLVEDTSTAYMAPEVISDDNNVGEHLDVFSLGAVAYHIFSGTPPAANGLELSNKLRETKGLQISSVLNGASVSLQELIQWSTHSDVATRSGLVSTVTDFLDLLEKVEEEATTPELETYADDPNRAKKDDQLPGGFRVIRRLGQGACSVVLLVEKDGEEFVLKVANDPEHNSRLRDEAEILAKLRHNHIVAQCGTLEVGDRFAFLMHPAFANKEERRIETLRDRLRHEGRLHIDLLQRFGEDLLEVLKYLEEEAGIPHRDIKPDNIAIGQIMRGDKLHLVLFDFSLSRAQAENLRAGTTGYLDPFLPLRKHKRWDLNAERYAAAATLFELAAGPNNFPKWGDGASDPSHLDCEATIDGDLFDASLRDGLTEFFQKAFRRNPEERFDNARQMLDAWRDCFVGIEEPGTLSDHEDEEEIRRLLESATFDTHIPELGLGTRATNALDRANILTVEDLLTVPMRRLLRLRGVGNRTRREIGAAVRILRERLGSPERSAVSDQQSAETDEPVDAGSLSVDGLFFRISQCGSREGETARATMMALLGFSESSQRSAISSQQEGVELTPGNVSWPSQSDIAPIVNVTRGRIGQLVGKFQARWAKDSPLTRLRGDIAEILTTTGGVMTVAELAEAILVARGSIQDEPRRTALATAVARACCEVERTMAEPRFLVRRDHGRVLVALSQDLASYAGRLGDEADSLADEDPLVPPTRVLQRLREVSLPGNASVLTDARLVRLAAAASKHAAVSSRQELYPRGMDAARAVKLSQGALYGVPFLTVQQIRDRVSGRYPEAVALPDRPELDDLLKAAGFDFNWDAAGKGAGCYVSRLREAVSITSGSESVSRMATSSGSLPPGEITPEVADARQFEERLERGLKEGSFLALMVHPKYYQRAAEELCQRFAVELVDFEGLFIDALREVAGKAGAKWEALVNADAVPGSEPWKKFMVLVNRAMPLVEQRLNAASKTMLLTYPGLLARYEQMPLLERLREKVGRRDGIPGVWLLIPGDNQALLDGKAIPIISPGQRTRIPEKWIRNEHRAYSLEKSGT
jgi:serine/threonine protein kinase